MKIEVLLSCMYQKDIEIVTKSNITTNVLLINQTDEEGRYLYQKEKQKIRLYNTRERGLSKSRNMAVEHAEGDICLICDDDEILENDYAEIIARAFQKLPDAAVIAFDVENKDTRLEHRVQKVGALKSLKLASCQLALNRKKIVDSGVRFDIKLGAGSGNGAGEENKFLLDCIKNHLSVYFVPDRIGKVNHGKSTWFSGYDEIFFYQRGMTTRYMLGAGLATVYGCYYVITKKSLYRSEISMYKAWKALMCGVSENKLKQ